MRRRQTAPVPPEFDKLGAEYWGFFGDEAPMIVKNNLRNVQDKDAWWGSDTNFYAPYYPATWFFES
jgi:hypothetical protein